MFAGFIRRSRGGEARMCGEVLLFFGSDTCNHIRTSPVTRRLLTLATAEAEAGVEEEGGRETMNQHASHAKVRRAHRCARCGAHHGQWHARGSEEDWIGGGVVRKKLVK